MLPPDKNNKSIFSFFTDTYKSIKSLVKNPYDESMLSKYCKITIEAMFYELIYLENDQRKFVTFIEIYAYLEKIYATIISHFKKGYYTYSFYQVITDVDQVFKLNKYNKLNYSKLFPIRPGS